MKRILIIALVLVGIWLLFDRANENEQTTPPENTATEEVETDTTAEEETHQMEEVTPEETVSETAEAEETVEQPPVEEISTETEVVVQPTYQAPKVKQPAAVAPAVGEEKAPFAMEMSSERDLEFVDDYVKVYLYEWAVDLFDSKVSSGRVAMEVMNNGQFTHHFAVRGVKNFGKVVPGQTRVFIVDLQPGDYEIYSPRAIDVENGMTETLFVD